MAFHHLAFATNDLAATHRFYTEVMGFELAKVVTAPTPSGKGWAKHVFYDTGGNGLIAFWELHDETIPAFDSALSTAVGLPEWVNHVAFDSTVDGIAERPELSDQPVGRALGDDRGGFEGLAVGLDPLPARVHGVGDETAALPRREEVVGGVALGVAHRAADGPCGQEDDHDRHAEHGSQDRARVTPEGPDHTPHRLRR